MRKNNGGRKSLEKLYFQRLKATGLNLDRLIGRLHNSGITLFDIKKGKKHVLFSVKGDDYKKVFAISKELCYNVVNLGKYGKLYPVYKLFQSFGVIVGALIFVAVAVVCSDVCFAVDFYGNGNVYAREVREYLNENGVKPYKKFSDFNLETLEDRLLADNDRFSFVSCEKVGCRLKIKLVLKDGNNGICSGNITALYSDVDGVVESVVVYRGTAQVGVGSEIKKGDLLVDGYALIRDEKVPTNVLAVVTVRERIEKAVLLSGENMDEIAVLIASQELKDREILSAETVCERRENGYEYTVKFGVKRVLIAG